MPSSVIYTLIFAKHPKPGQVMTRLCPPLSFAKAAHVQRVCLCHIWSMVKGRGGHCILVGSPDDSATRFQAILGHSIQFWPQGDGDLGDRLARASKRAFDSGANGVIFLGADHPTLDWTLIDRMADFFVDNDVVIGPAEDGGYYLLATRDHFPELYDGIDWGTEHVLSQTLERARDANLRVHQLETGYDVDRFEDLLRAVSDLDAGGATDIAVQLRDVIAAATGK